MKNGIVADGHLRFLRGKQALTSQSIEKKYAAEFAKAAAPNEKIQISERLMAELLRREKMETHKPSAATLW